MSPEPSAPTAPPSKPRLSTRNRLLFFFSAWLIVLMPFLFWWNTWFGRELSDQQLTQYLQDEKHPRHIQHALVQIGERIIRHNPSAARWYPDVLRLASYPVEEVRNTDAWVMGQAEMGNGAVRNGATGNRTSAAGFHEALLKMLSDPSFMVRGNAALSLVRFGDATGRPQIVALLHSVTVTAPQSGKVVDAGRVGTAIHQSGIIAKLEQDGRTWAVRSPISGRLRRLSVQVGQRVAPGAEIALVDPGSEQVWEALRALYLIGQPDDLSAVAPYERELPDIADRVRQQATLTEKAIQDRMK